MNATSQKSVLNIRILGKEYKIGCSPELENSLLHAAQYLDHKMRGIRDQSNVTGLDKIAVLAALHITHELLNSNSEYFENTKQIQNRVEKLNQKIASAIANKHQVHEEEFSYTD
jgi:cell division protein ZapA